MPPAAAVQRKAVGRAAVIPIPVLAILTALTVAALAVLRGGLWLAAGDERRQTLDVAVVVRLNVLRTLLIVLLLRLLLLRLKLLRLVLLLARIKRLRLRREGLTAHRRLIALAVVVVVIRRIAARVALLLVIGLRLAQLFLRGGDQAKIMFRMLIIIFGSDGIAGTLRVARELKIFLGDVRRGPANFHVLPVGLVHSRQWILMMPTLITVTTAHALILTVSHGLLFRNPLDLQRH
jgi:hypothetical protein